MSSSFIAICVYVCVHVYIVFIHIYIYIYIFFDRKKKHGAYVTNPDEFKSIGTHSITLHVNVDGGSTSHNALKIHRKQKFITNVYKI